MNQIVNNIRLTQNLTLLLRTQRIYNSTVKILNYIVMLIILVRIVVINYN